MLRWFRARKELYRIRTLELNHDVAGLIGELRNDADYGGDTIIRSYAALALGRLGDPRAASYLDELVDEPNDKARERVVRALVKLHANDSEPVFIKKLGDRTPVVRALAAEGLGSIGDSAAIPWLRQTLENDPDPEVRMYAVEALLKLGDDSARARIPEVMRGVSWLVRGHPRWKALSELRTPPS